MTIAMTGVCVDGQIAKQGSWREPGSGREVFGVGYTPCPECGGRGCTPRPAAVEDRVAALEGEVAALMRELADAKVDRED